MEAPSPPPSGSAVASVSSAAAAAASAMLEGQGQATAASAAGTRNPIASLLDGLRQVVVATLHLVAALVRFTSVTVPSLIYTVLHYSFTLQLNFPSLFFLFVLSLIAGFIWLRYRHLNRYERLREVPLTRDENFNLHPDVAASGEDAERSNFHNYLDEFLQAIRIFGFLEKPVFHELARHLQTRRLVAGDSISLDADFSFYIVIDGHVQVYAPLPTGPDGTPMHMGAEEEAQDDDEPSGYQLLNEVESGGTLSSLFTILSLFTEDVKLGFGDEDKAASQQGQQAQQSSQQQQNSGQASAIPASSPINGPMGRLRSRVGRSDEGHLAPLATPPSAGVGPSQLQLDAANLRNIPSSVGPMGAVERLSTTNGWQQQQTPNAAGDSSTSASTDDGLTINQGTSTENTSREGPLMDSSSNQSPFANAAAAAASMTNNHNGTSTSTPLLDVDTPLDEGLPPAQATAPFPHFSPSHTSSRPSMPSSQMHSPNGRPRGSFSPPMRGRTHSTATTFDGRPNTPGSILSGFSTTARQAGAASNAGARNAAMYAGGLGPGMSAGPSMGGGAARANEALHREGVVGTVGRATVDTTLAVIPAEAFKRLTKKYPNAAAHIVQVILTRLSRVTFHTAHKYLGLTKEVMRTEKHINELACFPLPSEFYEQGGMERLRQRFLPEPAKTKSPSAQFSSHPHQQQTQRSAEAANGYFGPLSGINGQARKQSAQTNRSSLSTPSAVVGSKPVVAPSQRPTTPWGHPDLPVTTPTSRTAVGPGDLLSMTGNDGALYHAGRSGSPFSKNFVSSPPASSTSTMPSFVAAGSVTSPSNGAASATTHSQHFTEEPKHVFGSMGPLGDFDVKEAVMQCIARSIGLVQAPPSPVNSMQQSPFIHPQDMNRGGSNAFNRSAFSNLSMLDAAMMNSFNDDGESSAAGSGFGRATNAGGYGGGFGSSVAAHSLLSAGGGGLGASSLGRAAAMGASSNASSAFGGAKAGSEGLENDVEVRFFPAGSILARAGDSKAGLFYVIDGFLDVIVPPDGEDQFPRKGGRGRKSARGRGVGLRGRGGSKEGLGRGGRGGSNGPPASTRVKDFTSHGRRQQEQQQQQKQQQQQQSHQKSRTNQTDGPRPGRPSRGDSASAGTPAVTAPSKSEQIGNALDGTSSTSKTARHLQEKTTSTPDWTNRHNRANGDDNADMEDYGDDGDDDDGEQSYGGKGRASAYSQPNQPKPLFTVGRGGIAGYLSSLLGTASYIDIRAKTDTYVGFLPARALERIMERRPIVLLTLCKRLLSLLSPLVLHIDSALDWQQVNAGHVIFREGDEADSFYIVINGRLRAIAEQGDNNGVQVLGEYGQGDSVGELDVITRSHRRKTLHAIRDSELAKMPMTLFNAISVRHPAITIQMSRIIAKRVRDEVNAQENGGAGYAGSSSSLNSGGGSLFRATPPVPGLPDLGRNNVNLKTVAIVPVTREVPIVEFAERLQSAFEDTISGPTCFLFQGTVMGVLGRHAFNRMGKLKLAGWLADQEQRYRLVVYVVDTAVSSAWTQTSIRQADCVLLVGFGDDPTMGEYERVLLGIKTTARKELVLLHPERSVPPGSTREWLKTRPWINAHHHVELPGIGIAARSSAAMGSKSFLRYHQPGDPSAVKALKSLKSKLEVNLLQRVAGQRHLLLQRVVGGDGGGGGGGGAGGSTSAGPGGRRHHFSDFARLARRLCGKSIGVVLGGGGARGCAHAGFLRSLEERGIPVDMIGGTSIGSLVGGLYAKEAEVVSSYGRVKKFAGRTASLWRFVLDLTYPVCSYTSGFEFNRGVFKAIGETHIEDMWLPYFCNTTNITWSRMEVHTSGYAWRYIRGSMTLAGLIPPLVDDGHMLVDGGYVDNLPVSVMFAMGARNVFAVDVGSIDDTSPRSYGDTLSGWWVVLNRWNPWSDARNIPSITDIQGRLTYVSSVKTLEEAKRTPGCLYLRMPVEGYGTMEFGKFNEIAQIGYDASLRALDEWEREKRLPAGYDRDDDDSDDDDDFYGGGQGRRLRRERGGGKHEGKKRGGISARRNSV